MLSHIISDTATVDAIMASSIAQALVMLQTQPSRTSLHDVKRCQTLSLVVISLLNIWQRECCCKVAASELLSKLAVVPSYAKQLDTTCVRAKQVECCQVPGSKA